MFDDPYVQNLNPFDEGFRQAISCENRDSFLTTQQSQDTLHTPQIIPDFITRPLKEEPQNVQEEPENLSLTPDTIPKIIVSNVEVTKPISILPKPSVIYATPLLATSASQIGDDRSNVRDKLKSVILGSSSDIKRVKLTENETKLNLPAILIATPIIEASGNLMINSGVGKIKKDVKSEEKIIEKDRNARRKSDCSKVERNRAAARRYR